MQLLSLPSTAVSWAGAAKNEAVGRFVIVGAPAIELARERRGDSGVRTCGRSGRISTMAVVCPLSDWGRSDSFQVHHRLPNSRAESVISEPSKQSTVATAAADGSVDFRGRPANTATTGGWKTAPTLFGAALFEAVVNLGIAFNLNLYLLGPMHIPAIPAATALSNYWGASYLTSLLGGFLSDAYLGNFWTILIAMLVELVGATLLIISSTVPPLEPECVPDPKEPASCLPASKLQYSIIMLSLYLIAVGAGSIRPCLSSFAGDQFDQRHPQERPQTPSFFNYLVVSISAGGILATTLIVHLGEHVSWTWGFVSIGAAMVVAGVCFVAGIGVYRYRKQPAGSPLVGVARVVVAALRNRKVKAPADCNGLHEVRDVEAHDDGSPRYFLRHTKGLRWLDKAAVEDTRSPAETASPWRLCTVTQVEEVKGLLRCLPIALSTMLLYMVLAQVQTWTTTQGYTMERRIGPDHGYLIPPATLSAIAIAVVLLEVAAYDFFLVPVFRRFTGDPHGLTHLQRIGTGLALSVIGLGYAALLESIRLDIARTSTNLGADGAGTIVPLSIFWQLPILVIMGTAIFFAHAGLFEFFYYESPPRMRSTGTALSMLPIAMGLFQNGGFMEGVNTVTKHVTGKGWLESEALDSNHLNYFYLLMAVMSLVNFAIYLITARYYEYKEFMSAASPGAKPPHAHLSHSSSFSQL